MAPLALRRSLGGFRGQLALGLQRYGGAGLWRRGRALAVFCLGLEDAAYARAERGLAGRGGLVVRTAFGFEKLGVRVVRDIVATYLIGALAQQRPIEQLEKALLPVVLRA